MKRYWIEKFPGRSPKYTVWCGTEYPYCSLVGCAYTLRGAKALLRRHRKQHVTPSRDNVVLVHEEPA